jgi:hypothetical protein
MTGFTSTQTGYTVLLRILSAALAPALMREVPEIEKITRIFPGWGATWLIKNGDKKIIEDKLWRVDSSFFDVFTIAFTRGNKETALKDTRSIVLTESAARRYFGEQDPVGKTLNLKPGENMLVKFFRVLKPKFKSRLHLSCQLVFGSAGHHNRKIPNYSQN